jgi:uncharacterized phage protein gp47/JayE
MSLSLKTFSQLIEDMGATLQSSATALVDISVGSVIRAIFEANASVALWMQWLILQVLQTTRAATSSGSDLDSWMMDFGLTRLPASPSSGTVIFSRFANSLPAAIPVGSIVKTADGALSFVVTEDERSSIWSPAESRYVLPAGVSAASVPVTCTSGGVAGNVLAGAVSVISASLPGIDRVTNTSPFTNGLDAESDSALRTRFQSYLASRSRATLSAVRNAIANVQQGLDVLIQENVGVDGSAKVGCFIVTIDDGSGYPSSDLLTSVASAIDAVRPIGTDFLVLPPKVMTVSAALTVTLVQAAASSMYAPEIQARVADYLNGLAIGRVASITRVAQNAYLAGQGIENISEILLNGSASDITPPVRTVIQAGTVTVTIDGG